MLAYLLGLALLFVGLGLVAPKPPANQSTIQQLSGDPPACPYPSACKP